MGLQINFNSEGWWEVCRKHCYLGSYDRSKVNGSVLHTHHKRWQGAKGRENTALGSSFILHMGQVACKASFQQHLCMLVLWMRICALKACQASPLAEQVRL